MYIGHCTEEGCIMRAATRKGGIGLKATHWPLLSALRGTRASRAVGLSAQPTGEEGGCGCGSGEGPHTLSLTPSPSVL